MAVILLQLTEYYCRIIRAIGCQLHEVSEVEELMRNVILHSEFDHLTTERFNEATITPHRYQETQLPHQ